MAYLGQKAPPGQMKKLKKLRKALPNGKVETEEAEEVVWVDQRKLKVGSVDGKQRFRGEEWMDEMWWNMMKAALRSSWILRTQTTLLELMQI